LAEKHAKFKRAARAATVRGTEFIDLTGTVEVVPPEGFEGTYILYLDKGGAPGGNAIVSLYVDNSVLGTATFATGLKGKGLLVDVPANCQLSDIQGAVHTWWTNHKYHEDGPPHVVGKP
jgi:hypothetical protein